MADNEIGSLYISIKTDMAKLNQEIIATQAKMTSLANTVESAMQTLANNTTRTASKAVSASRDSYTEQVKYANQLNIDTEQKAVAHAEKLTAVMRSAVQRQFELDDKAALSEKKKQDRMLQIASEARDKLEQREIKDKGQAEARRLTELQATEKAAQKRADAQQKALDKIDKAEESTHNKTLERISRTVAAIAAVMAARFILGGIEQLFTATMTYLGELEQASFGISASFLTQGKYIDQLTGKILDNKSAFVSAQSDAIDVIERLKIANLETIATLDQLVKAYELTLPVAMARGFDKKQVEEFTLSVVQAAGAIDKTLLNQLGEETRSMLTGNISERNSRLAVILGLKDDPEYQQARKNADSLFTFLMEKLSAFKIAGIEAQKSWFGILSNLKDKVMEIAGKAFVPLFDALKLTLDGLQNSVVSINTVTKNMEWNPEFLKGITNFKLWLTESIVDLYRMGMMLDQIGGTLSTLKLFTAIPGTERWENILKENKALQDKYNQTMIEAEKFKMGQEGFTLVTPDIQKRVDALLESRAPEGWNDKAWQSKLDAIRKSIITVDIPYRENQLDTMQHFKFILTEQLKFQGMYLQNKERMSDTEKNLTRQTLDNNLKLKLAEYNNSLELEKSTTQTSLASLSQELAKKTLLQSEYEDQKTQRENGILASEINFLTKRKNAIIAAFEEQQKYLTDNPLYQDSITGVFTGEKELKAAEEKMLLESKTIENQIALKKEEQNRNTIKYKTIEIELADLLHKKQIQEENQISSINASLAKTTENYQQQKNAIDDQLAIKVNLMQMDEQSAMANKNVIADLQKQAEFEKQLVDIEKQRKQISIEENTISAQQSYAESIDDINAVNAGIQAQVYLKNRAIDLDSKFFLQNNPEMKGYIDKIKELNQKTADHTILLNNIKDQRTFAEMNSQLAELTSNWGNLKDVEQVILDKEIEGLRITLSGNEKLLDIYEQIYKIKSEANQSLPTQQEISYQQGLGGFQEQSISARSSYAVSIGDMETVNKTIQESVNLKNKLFALESAYFAFYHPEAKQYIDEILKINQQLANQQKLLNEIKNQKTFAEMNTQFGELTNNWDLIKKSEQTILDKEIEGLRITLEKSQDLLAVYEKIYAVKSKELQNLPTKQEIASIQGMSSLQGQAMSEESAYATSIGDMETVNRLIQVELDLKNKLFILENGLLLFRNPAAQQYIDQIIRQNQLTADQQILLNNLAKQTTITDASKQIAELTYNWDDLTIAEQKTLDLAIEKQRIENQANPELLAYLEQIYQLKSRNISLDVRSKALAMQEPVAQAATSLYATSGNENLLTYVKDYNNKVIALTKDRNATIYTDEKEAAMLLLALKQDTNDKLYQLELARYNKQYEAYSKLYKATGLQQYADKLVQIENQILDKEDYFNNQIVDNEQDAFRLRQIRMQEFYQSRLDMIESTGNKEIAKAKEIAEIVASFNVPLAGSNISSMTGMPIGTVGQRFGNTNYPGVWFGSQQELTDYMKNFNQTSFAGGLVKVSGPATGGSDQWFKTMQDANKFIEDWKNGLGQATTSVSNLSSAVDTLTSKFQSSYQSFQSFLTERERRNWTGADWTREFDRLVSVFTSNPDVETQINTLNSMLDVLKELDKTEQEILQTQKQIANDFLSSAKSVDELINSLKFGPMNPGVSYGGMTTQYESLKSGAVGTSATAEGVNKFTSFIQNTYLPFMKTYGSGYFDKLDEVTSELGLVSDELKGKAAYISLADALGINISIKKPITNNDIFDYSQLTATQLSWFTDDTTSGYSLFEKMGTWTAEQMYLFGTIANSLFTKKDWGPEDLYFWGNVVDNSKDTKWKVADPISFWDDVVKRINLTDWKNPDEIDFWSHVVTKVNPEKWKNPETVDFWSNVVKITDTESWKKAKTVGWWTTSGAEYNVLEEVGKWESRKLDLFTNILNIDALQTNWNPETFTLFGELINLDILSDSWVVEDIKFADLYNFDFAGLFTDISTGNLTSATEKINDLIGILGGTTANGLVGSSGSAQTGIENLVKKFTGTNPTESLFPASSGAGDAASGLSARLVTVDNDLVDTANKSIVMANTVKSAIDSMNSFFTVLATRVNTTFNAATGGTVAVPTQVNTVERDFAYAENVKYVPSDIMGGGWVYEYWDPVSRRTEYSKAYPGKIYFPKKAEGGLTSGLSIAGEIGPEYVVPTYEPQRSNFLKTMGVDTDKISAMMVTEQINTMSNFLDGLQIPSSNYEAPKYESPSTNTINIDSEKIGKEIARQLAASLVTTGSNGKEMHFHIKVGSKEIADVIASEIYNGHEGLAKNIKRLVGVR